MMNGASYKQLHHSGVDALAVSTMLLGIVFSNTSFTFVVDFDCY